MDYRYRSLRVPVTHQPEACAGAIWTSSESARAGYRQMTETHRYLLCTACGFIGGFIAHWTWFG